LQCQLPIQDAPKHATCSPNTEACSAPARQFRGPYCVYADEAVTLLRSLDRKATRLEIGFPDWKARHMGIMDHLRKVGDPVTGKPIGTTLANLEAAIAGESPA